MLNDAAIPDVRLRTPRLLLRPLVIADLPEHVRYRTASAEHLRPWEPLPAHEQTMEQQSRWAIELGMQRAASGQGVKLVGVICRDNDSAESTAIVGMFNLNNIVRGAFQNADAGWNVSAEHLGCGFATEGVLGLLTLAFALPPHGLGLHRVQANIDPMNIRSLRVAEKCGFRREGMARRMLEINGQWRDQWMHAKLAEEHNASPLLRD